MRFGRPAVGGISTEAIAYPGDLGAVSVRTTRRWSVALNRLDAKTKWGQLEVFMTQWRRIERLIGQPGPLSSVRRGRR
jgi:hypothetical protein